MGSPPASTTAPPPPSLPSPPPPPPTSDASASTSAVKRTHKASRLRSLTTRPPGVERPVVHVDPATGKADGPHKKKLRTYLGIVARDKVDITYENWKEVPTAQKDLIWEDIQAEFDIPEASDIRTKRKLLQTMGERWRQFKSDLTRKWALAADQDGVEDTVCDKYGISKEKWAQFCQTRRDPSWEDVRMKAQAIQKHNTAPHVLSRGGYDYLEQKLLAEKTKKKMQEAAQSGSVDGVIDPPSPVRHHVKWKTARTKKTGEMTTEAAKEIAEKIDLFEEQATQGSFVPHGRQDVLATAIGRPEHPGRVCAAGAGVTIKKYFGSAPRTSHSASSLPPDKLQQLTQQIRDQLEESITEKVTRQVMASFSHLQSQMQSQGVAVPPEPVVGPGPSGPRVSTKGSCVDPSGNDPETGDSDKCGLYIEEDPACLVAIGRVYEGSTVVHNTPLLPGQVKVSVGEVRDVDAPVPVPTDEVSLVGQALHTFLAWPTHLVKYLSQQVAVSPPKPPPKPDPEVDDLLYLMTLTIPELFLRPYQVRWDATVFGVINPDFPLYIKHEDFSKIAHGGQCLSISVLQLWILHFTETCMRAGNSDIYGFLEPQSIQRSGQSQFESESYIKSWMQSSQRDQTLADGGHPAQGTLSCLGLDDAPQPKSKAPARWIVVKCNRQKGTTECGYYVMHWMSTIILGTFTNNWEAVVFDNQTFNASKLMDEALLLVWSWLKAMEKDLYTHFNEWSSNLTDAFKDVLATEVSSLRGELQQERDERDRQLSQVQTLSSELEKVKESRKHSYTELDSLTLKANDLEEKCSLKDNLIKALEEQLATAEKKLQVSNIYAYETRTEYKGQQKFELKGNIRVFCRVRPLLADESCSTEGKIFSYPTSMETSGRAIDLAQNVFTPEASQEEVFVEISQLVQSALDGYKVCIFAYGQTGSGKTYTMMGRPGHLEEKGLIPRSLEQIFQTKQSQQPQGVNVGNIQ
ncbi:Kinesin-like protein KIN-14C [Glycine max]|nr:Kinesin-like protein KIN-14C [Glycine max]